jgi:hypothetical protein
MSAQSGYYDDGLGLRELDELGERVEHTLGNEAKPDAIDADVALARPWVRCHGDGLVECT